MTPAPPTPFAQTCDTYRENGWTGVLPLPLGEKKTPPTGYTGPTGAWPTDADVDTWKATAGNVALRLPADVVGLDVDAYGDKPGAATLEALERDLGPLPATVRSTSRQDGVSGIRLYRAPAGLTWRNLPGIDLLHVGHRYAVAPPSIHPDGDVYRWLTADGDEAPLPAVEDLPALPEAWISRLTTAPTGPATDEDVAGFLASLPTGAPSRDVADYLRDFEAALDGSGRHEAMLQVIDHLAVAGAGGGPGVPEALALARDAFTAVKGYEGESEWDRALAGTVARIRSGALHVHPHGVRLAFGDPVPCLWDERPVLRHLHDFAKARVTSPHAVLGVALARALTMVPPWVVLPPIVGGFASLNTFVALVGESGQGKGAAIAAAAEALEVGDVYTASVGSGEGISHLFASRSKDEITRHRDAVLFRVDEVDSLTALGNRQGATLMPQLRSAWSGEALGFAYADPKKALRVEPHTYRLNVLVGVQPARAEALLEDSDGGTPQRFLWLPTGDPDALDDPPEAPAPMPWSLPEHRWSVNDQTNGVSRHVLDVPESVKRTIRRARAARMRGEGDALDGHELQARLKVSAGLAVLDERTSVTEDDWRVAGLLMASSNATRTGVAQVLRHRAERTNVARGEAEAIRAVTVEKTVASANTAAASTAIVRALEKARDEGKDGLPAGKCRAAVTKRVRSYADDALEALVNSGQIVGEPFVYNGAESIRYRLA